MSLSRRNLHVLADERGSVLVVAGLVVVVMALLATVIIEVGQTMSHRRHLQVQADAAALAAAQEFPLCATDPSNAYSSMAAIADQYGGFGGPASFNQQAGNATGYAGQVERTYQSPNYPAAPSGYSQHPPENDPVFLNSDGSPDTDTQTLTCGDGTPGSTQMFDVKASEYGIHGVFNFGISSTVNAHARVELKAVNEATGLLPLAVPDVRPKYIFATFIDESTGSPIAGCPSGCTEELTKQPGSPTDNQQTWAPTSGSELAVPIVAGHMGVRIRLIGADDPTLQCGQLYTQCYDASSPNGVVHIRGWQGGTAPIAKDVWLLPGSGSTACAPDAYFTQVACSAGIKAMIDMNTAVTPTSHPAVWATVDGGNTKYQLTPAASGSATVEWDGAGIPISGDGPHNIELFYGTGKGTSLGVVQRAYVANPSGSGPLNLVQVYQAGVNTSGANSFQAGATPTLGVVVKTIGNLLISQPTDPPIYLRVFNDSGSASQNQSLDCEPQGSPYNNLKDQIAHGCTPWYKTQTALTCPASTWIGMQALPQPWTCVGINTGASVGQVWQGLNQRIYGDPNAPTSDCASYPVNWIKPQNADPANGIDAGFDQTKHPNDRRVLPLFVTPLGTFQQTGGGVVPLIDFGYFYVTGYKNDPCQGTPNQDPVPANRGAYILGHFIKYFPIDAQHHPSDDNCDLTTITPCVGVLTR